ncbi:MAG: hypothetical protein SF097_03715 [Acidobacteriota bacterium]|nr:hypothetical protein [Acidobacteriota bacterium]
MRLFKSSSLRTAFIVVVSYSLALSLSFSLRLASVSANSVNPTGQASSSAPPSKLLATVWRLLR